MKQRIFTYIAALCTAGFSLLALNSCKEDTILGANVIPVGDTANTIQIPDTFQILTKTVYDDSIITSQSISGVPIYHALGTVATDPYSGRTNAGFYFQVIQPSLGFNFPQVPDSAVLILPYAGFTWGDTLSNIDQVIKVYEVAATDSIIKDSTYYSFSKTAIDPQEIGSTVIGYNANGSHQAIKDSVTVLGTKQAPHVRIRLSQAFIDKIKNEAAKTSGSALGGYAEFGRFQRGLYISTADSTSGNALYYFALNGTTDFTKGNIQFYYTDQTGTGGADTVKYVSFPFDQTRNSHYNRITRNYSGTPTGNWMASAASSDSVTILQNEPGAAIDIRIPHIKNLPKQPIIKAELVLTQYKFPGDQSEIYAAPGRLYPVRVSSTNGIESIQDRYPLTSSEPLLFIDGAYKEVTIDGTPHYQYIINIPREIQRAIVEQRDTLHLRINGAATFPGAYRIVTGGRNMSNDNYKLKLRIYYSKI